jgi:hypothetical protein
LKHAAFVILIVLLTAIVAVSYANPEFLENHPDVDPGDEPAELAHDAILNLRAHDYNHTTKVRGWNGTGSRFNYSVENTNERYAIFYQMDNPVAYANEGAGWRYGGGSVKRQVLYRDRATQIIYKEDIANPDIDARKVDWHVVNENESTVVLRTDSPDELRFGSQVLNPLLFNPESHLDLHVDKQKKRATRMVIKEASSKEEREHNYVVHEFSDFGETTVERPREAPWFSLNEIIFRIISEHRDL